MKPHVDVGREASSLRRWCRPPVRASGGSSPPKLGPPPATRLAERAPAGYITPTIRPLRGARWLLTTLLTGFPTTERANAVSCPRGAAAWTAAIRACPRRWSAADGRAARASRSAPRDGAAAARDGRVTWRAARELAPSRPGPCHRQGAGPNEIADQPLELLARLNKRNQSCGSTSPLARTDPLNAAQGVALW